MVVENAASMICNSGGVGRYGRDDRIRSENSELAGVTQCKSGPRASFCNNNKEAKTLKVIAIFSILVASVIGVSLPLVTRKIPALGPDRDYFVIVKATCNGESFRSRRLSLISALLTLMVDSYAMSSQKKRMLKTQANDVVDTLENGSHVLEKEHGSDVLELGIVVHSVVCQSSIDCT
ncbi:hypothetical protein YC2023_057481 [Brassica napus]